MTAITLVISIGDIDGLGVHNWFLRQQAGWTFNPSPDQRNGYIQFGPDRPHFTWSGTSSQHIVFDLGQVVLERIEFVGMLALHVKCLFVFSRKYTCCYGNMDILAILLHTWDAPCSTKLTSVHFCTQVKESGYF